MSVLHTRPATRTLRRSALLAVVLWLGCGGPSPRPAIEGSVTLDGGLVNDGTLTLRPDDRSGPIAVAVIRDGFYTLSEGSGPSAGNHIASLTVQSRDDHAASRGKLLDAESPPAPRSFEAAVKIPASGGTVNLQFASP